MARKVFISVLGAGLYEKCKYVSGDFCSSETNFIQLATLEYLQYKSEWTSECKAYFLLTNKAKAVNWEVKDNMRYDKNKGVNVAYTGLKQSLDELLLPFSYEMVPIPDGKNESEMWEIFENTYNLLEEGDELYFDLTHSFRYLPMLMLVLGNYAKFLKKATVCGISYGNHEVRDVSKNEAPIVDLLPLSSLQDWTFATADFLKNGYTDRLVGLSEKSLEPLMRNAESRTDDTKRLKSFVNNLKIFSLDMQTCRGLNIIDATTIERLKTDMNALQRVVIPQLKPVLRKVQKSIDPFNDSKEVANAFNAAQWCYNNQQYQQSVTFLEEGIISYFCLRHGIDLDDRNKRELVTSAFNIIIQDIPQDNWRVSNPEWMDLLKEIVSDNLLESLSKEFASVSALRNDYNHCGMRKGALKSGKIRERIKMNLDSIIPLLRNPIQNKVSDATSKYLINFSNHPSAFWEEKQKQAAMEYGDIIDIPFPAVNPDSDYNVIQELAEKYTDDILSYANSHHITVHIMGEMTFTFLVVSLLKERGIECIASTSNRNTEVTSDNKKISEFQFVRFRKY